MKREPKILLAYPPNQLLDIETPRPDGSLGPLYLAGALEKEGFATDILDMSVGPENSNLKDTFYRSIKQENGLVRIGMSREDIKKYIASGGYNIIAINSNFTPQTKMALEVASVAKSVDSNILVIVGGVNVRNLPNYFFDSGNVDAICLTEGEKIITRIVNNFISGDGFENVSGIMYKEDEKIVTIPAKPDDIYTDLDCLPFPTWRKLPFNHYDSIAAPHSAVPSSTVRYASIMTSRGCPFSCSYCHISIEKENNVISSDIGNLRLKSVERVLKELEYLQTLGVKKVYFEDDSLLAKKNRVKEIFRHMVGLGMEIANVNGVNLVHFAKPGKGGQRKVDVEYLEFLKEAGFKQIVFPVESGSQRIIDKYATAKLKLKTFNVIELVREASKIGITCPINMMIGFPDETEKEILQSIELGRELVEAGAEYCTLFIPIPFPGSRLFNIALDKGYLDRDFDPDMMNWKRAIMKNTTVSPKRIVELRDWGWRKINTKEHVATRLKLSVGARWQD